MVKMKVKIKRKSPLRSECHYPGDSASHNENTLKLMLFNFFSRIHELLSLIIFRFIDRLGREQNVDTSTFRMATWNYIHLVYGIYHDDYLYTEVCVAFCYIDILIFLELSYWLISRKHVVSSMFGWGSKL